MKHPKRTVAAFLILAVCLISTGCPFGDDDFTPDARISMTTSKKASDIATQQITVDAMKGGFFKLRISVIGKGGEHTLSVGIIATVSLVGSGKLMTSDILTLDSGETKDFDLKLAPGTYVVLLDGIQTPVSVTVNPYGTTQPAAPPAA